MARFVVDLSEQGRGLEMALLRDALHRAPSGAEAIGRRAFFVRAKYEEVRAFCQRFGMEASPTDPLHLFLLFKDIRHSLPVVEEDHALD